MNPRIISSAIIIPISEFPNNIPTKGAHKKTLSKKSRPKERIMILSTSEIESLVLYQL
jgi:hypothetical protein